MLAASPARIMRRPPADIHSSEAGAFGARPTVVDSIIIAGEAASITSRRLASARARRLVSGPDDPRVQYRLEKSIYFDIVKGADSKFRRLGDQLSDLVWDCANAPTGRGHCPGCVVCPRLGLESKGAKARAQSGPPI